jgi:hypothetical protein
MKQITGALVGAVLGCCLLSNATQASIIQSLTIEEIGGISGGLGTSGVTPGGGKFAISATAINSADTDISPNFISAGSSDGAILTGVSQGDSAFTPGFVFANLTINPNTSADAPSGLIDSGGNLILDLSGWGVDLSDGFGYFPLSPDAGTLVTSIAAEAAHKYFYTADWHHQVSKADDPSNRFVGLTTYWHLEGIATVPEPGTIWLIGIALPAWFGVYRRQPA